MTDVLGSDCDGRPLRAQDKVVLLYGEECAQPWIGQTITITGADEDGEMVVDICEDEWGYYVVDGPDVRKLIDGDRPADESFGDMMRKLTSDQPVEA